MQEIIFNIVKTFLLSREPVFSILGDTRNPADGGPGEPAPGDLPKAFYWKICI